MNENEKKGRITKTIQDSDLAISILTGISLIGLFLTLKFTTQINEIERRFVLVIMGVVALIGIFYLATRFFNMYRVLEGAKAAKMAFIF